MRQTNSEPVRFASRPLIRGGEKRESRHRFGFIPDNKPARARLHQETPPLIRNAPAMPRREIIRTIPPLAGCPCAIVGRWARSSPRRPWEILIVLAVRTPGEAVGYSEHLLWRDAAPSNLVDEQEVRAWIMKVLGDR